MKTYISRSTDRHGGQRTMEEICLAIQRKQTEFIELNRRLMEGGKIDFDEYEEIK